MNLVAAPAPPATAVAELEPVTEAPVVVMMTEDEAKDAVNRINQHVGRIRSLLLDMYERQGWRALGYKSWRACVAAEFDQSQSYLYRQLDAAKSERDISPIGERLPESHLRKLSDLEPEQKRAVYAKALETAPNGKVTASHLAVVKESITRNEHRARVNAEQSQRNALADLGQRLREKFQTNAGIRDRKRGGWIMIQYYSNDDLERILSLLGVSKFS
jgi:hypothetical protein